MRFLLIPVIFFFAAAATVHGQSRSRVYPPHFDGVEEYAYRSVGDVGLIGHVFSSSLLI